MSLVLGLPPPPPSTPPLPPPPLSEPGLKQIVCQPSRTVGTAHSIGFNLSIPNTSCCIPNGSQHRFQPVCFKYSMLFQPVRSKHSMLYSKRGEPHPPANAGAPAVRTTERLEVTRGGNLRLNTSTFSSLGPFSFGCRLSCGSQHIKFRFEPTTRPKLVVH